MGNRLSKTVTYARESTGEVTSQIHSFVPEPFNEKGYLFYKQKASVRCFMDHPLPRELTFADKGRVCDLRMYLLIDSQKLCYRSNKNIYPLSAPQMSKIFELSEDRTAKLLSRLKMLSVLKECVIDGVVWYMMNPLYGMKDKRLTLDTYVAFQNELKDELPDWALREFLSQVNEICPRLRVLE